MKEIEKKFIEELNKQIKGYNGMSGFPELSLMNASSVDNTYLEEIINSMITGKIQADELRQRCYDLERLIISYDNKEFE